jgi:hypothetical protein
MNNAELKKLWQEQPLNPREISMAQLVSAMKAKTIQFRRDLRARDARELAACALVIIIFGWYFLNEPAPVARLGWLIVVASSFFIAAKLVHARRTTRPAPPGATLVESLRSELNSVRVQSRLLGTVLWWYLLPPGIGLLIATWGMKINLHAKVPLTLVFFATYGFVYWANQWARSKHLSPLEAQLDSMLRSAETGEPMDQTHVADLLLMIRPSTVAQAEPVQFSIAFWQLALYGEIGFVGIWFFGMLSLTDGNLVRMLSWHRLIWVVPFFVAGLLLSWLLKISTNKAVGIGAPGIYLLRGQQLILWDEITEIRPLRVLSIRSLWLIRKSGEKLIMPWTGLERHSELRAAVERFAPTNHPIRNYLSLLRRN